jgi:hypothetical protein
MDAQPLSDTTPKKPKRNKTAERKLFNCDVPIDELDIEPHCCLIHQEPAR